MSKKIIAVSDCDHLNMNEEEKVCRDNGLALKLFQCRTEDDLIRDLPGYAAVINQYAPFTERVFAALPDLRFLVRYGVGMNNVDIEAATRHGVAVSNVPDYGVQEVASQAFAMMMALTRRILQMDASVKAGHWDYTEGMPIFRLREQTIGIIGMGRIGHCFAQLVRPLGCRILACDLVPERVDLDYVQKADLETLVSQSDVISVHSNLETSYNLINRDMLSKMKKTAFLINVSRGGIIDEEALADALNAGRLAGAGIDVTATEPLPSDSPLRTAKNILLSPHIAWYSEQSSLDLKTKAAEEATRFLLGEPLHYQLNRI